MNNSDAGGKCENPSFFFLIGEKNVFSLLLMVRFSVEYQRL